jgi:hypothetical protein
MSHRPLSIMITVASAFILCMSVVSGAQEVDKGQISAEHLADSCKLLPWGCPVWDTQEALASMNSGVKALWIDTRPESFFKQGSVRNSLNLVFDKSTAGPNGLTKEKLQAAIQAAGLSEDSARIIFFCQGPECHRSYNASYVAVKEWGFKSENVVWFRAGYPLLLKEIQGDPKLKRRAVSYLTDEAIGDL